MHQAAWTDRPAASAVAAWRRASRPRCAACRPPSAGAGYSESIIYEPLGRPRGGGGRADRVLGDLVRRRRDGAVPARPPRSLAPPDLRAPLPLPRRFGAVARAL